jgi:Ca2+-binding RTX toxin-like protein
MGPIFSGTLDGGAGIDTLEVDVAPSQRYFDEDPRYFDAFSFRETALSGFEHLRFGSMLEISIDQLNSFQTIRHTPGTLPNVELFLFGPGGSLNLATQIESTATTYILDGSRVSSGITIVGSSESDSIEDSPFDDEISTGDGDDFIVHTSGADTLVGGDGVDTVEFDWNSSKPLVLKHIVTGAALPDGTVMTEFERFRVVAGEADDTIYGLGDGEEGDSIEGGGGDDVIHGFGGADNLYGYGGDDTLYGGDGDDYLLGMGGEDVIHGGDGNDYIDGGYVGGVDAYDRLYGGAGDDSISAGANDDAFGGDGNDRVDATEERSGFGSSTLHGGNGDDRIDTYAFYVAYGETGNDRLTAKGTGDVRYFGGDGIDELNGAGGDDFLHGGRDADIMRGKAGDDTYIVDDTGDTVIELADEGQDTLQAGFGYILPEHVENLVQTGTADANAWGNAEDNMLTGNAGNNRLNGLAGADTMIGGLGDDTYIVDDPGDTVVELAGEGFDIVQSSGSVYLSAHVERLELMGKANANGVGTDSVNYLTGNDGNNILTGKGGLDALEGGGGADTFRYLALSDSNAVTGMDRIVDFDFAEGDRVNVSAIDANAGLAGNQAFDTLIAADAAFTEAGQFRFSKQGNYFLAEFNANGDPTAELAIRFQGIEPPEETWFIL